jgi:hypothetical protein
MLELSDGSVAIVDGDDLPRVARYEWQLPASSLARYPVGQHCDDRTVCETVFLHRLIANAGPDDTVIHRNHNTLDNRRENLIVLGRRVSAASVGLNPRAELSDWIAAD